MKTKADKDIEKENQENDNILFKFRSINYNLLKTPWELSNFRLLFATLRSDIIYLKFMELSNKSACLHMCRYILGICVSVHRISGFKIKFMRYCV